MNYRRLRTRLRRFPALTLLLLAVAGGAWWRGHSRADVWILGGFDGSAQAVGSGDAGLWVGVSNLPLGSARRLSWDHLSASNDEFYRITTLLAANAADFHKDWHGFSVGKCAGFLFGVPNGWYCFAAMPHWPLVALLALVLALRLRRWHRYQRRASRGLCLHCGYDLRASTGRCPECGELIVTEGKPEIRSPKSEGMTNDEIRMTNQ